jgi:pyrroloquinoline quinone (PQQ) biosynthesis protein C
MDRDDFKEALLGIMERKTHWAWPSFTNGVVRKERLHVHLEQEYATYVRDFPILVARAYIACPIAVVRHELIENVYEEETGGIHAGRPHPELFLEYPRGLGMDLARFGQVTLLPTSRSYRAFLDEATLSRGWEVGAAVTTLFVEGTAHERAELDPAQPGRAAAPLEEHPLVRHYGLSLDHLLLTKAHRAVEGEHRAAAWRVMLDHVSSEARPAVVESMERALALWLGYRDGVAEACGLSRSGG